MVEEPPLEADKGKRPMEPPEKRLQDDECFLVATECSHIGATRNADKDFPPLLSYSSRSLDIKDNIDCFLASPSRPI